MPNQDQIDLIKREFDDTNSPEESAAFRSLMERDPPPHLKQAILAALPRQAPATSVWDGIENFLKFTLGGGVMNRKALILGSAVVAVAIIIAARVTGFPPVGGGEGTIGGVEQAARYKGRAMTQADVTLQNPEIQALFQNHEILALVQSDVFREAMRNSAFRELQASESYRQVMASEANRRVMASDAARQIMANDAYRQVMDSDAFRQIMANDAFRQLQANEAFRSMQANAAYRQLQANDAFRQLQSNDAFRQLQANEAFRSLSRSAALSDVFMNEAMRSRQ